PLALGLVVGVRHIVTGLRALAGDLADSCHTYLSWSELPPLARAAAARRLPEKCPGEPRASQILQQKQSLRTRFARSRGHPELCNALAPKRPAVPDAQVGTPRTRDPSAGAVPRSRSLSRGFVGNLSASHRIDTGTRGA